MARSDAATVSAYLEELPPERRAVVSAVRDLVNASLPKGYVEGMSWGMIAWEIPLSVYPDTYNKRPLCFVALAAQKNAYSLYLNTVYGEGEHEKALRAAFEKAGKKLDMGKSCVRFKRLEDLETEAIAKVIQGTPPKAFIAQYEASRAR